MYSRDGEVEAQTEEGTERRDRGKTKAQRDRMEWAGEQGLGETEIQNKMKYGLFQSHLNVSQTLGNEKKNYPV